MTRSKAAEGRKKRFASRQHHRQPRYVLGLMAGTSGDGIDAACVRIRGVGADMRVELVLHHHRPFSPSLRRRLSAAMAPADTTTQEIARLHADLGDAFGRSAVAAINKLPPRHRPSLVGLAGQTVCHLPDRRPGRTVTLQLGDPARVVVRTGLPVVADFRQSDVAAGGQGAPLVPWTDWVLFRHPKIDRIVQNIGGIGNLTCLPAGGGQEDVIAFDTGPGNMIIDGLAVLASGGRESMDRNGRRAARGRVLEGVLSTWLKHPFLVRRPPKSTGREEFGRVFIERELPRLRRASRLPDDWVATATAFTAHSIGRACRLLLPGKHRPCELILCGGGAKNPVLTGFLGRCLCNVTICAIDSLDVPSQAKEALSFAMLAAARMDGVPANLPQVTGANRPVVLGSLNS